MVLPHCRLNYNCCITSFDNARTCHTELATQKNGDNRLIPVSRLSDYTVKNRSSLENSQCIVRFLPARKNPGV